MVPSKRKNPYLAHDIKEIQRGIRCNALLTSTQLLKQVQSLGIITNEHDLVVGSRFDLMKEPVEWKTQSMVNQWESEKG